jgi:uncharacterized BrkB/YihY/UPF0761 family membrane protein
MGTEMFLPTVLFLLFTVFSTVGAYWILSRHVSRKAGIWGALATLLFFVALLLALGWMLRSGGFL